MSLEFQYKVTEAGYQGLKLRTPGETLVSHGEPLVKASWYKPLNDNAKKAWGDKPKAKTKAPEGDSGEGGDNNPVQHDPEVIMSALAELDHDNDDQWTKGGKPDLAYVNKIYTGEGTLKREDVEPLNVVRVQNNGE